MYHMVQQMERRLQPQQLCGCVTQGNKATMFWCLPGLLKEFGLCFQNLSISLYSGVVIVPVVWLLTFWRREYDLHFQFS
jgi:hypothetical protein